MNPKRPYLVRTERQAFDLIQLDRMQPQQLQQIYKEMFCREVPAGSAEHARRKIAWHLQAEREGGLPDSARQHALAIARDVGLRVRMSKNLDRRGRGVPLEHTITTRVVSDHDSRLPMPGSNIIKKHRGQNIVVRVLSSGFEYDGRRFTSLSAIAADITGTKWNGFVFFGLGKERTGAR